MTREAILEQKDLTNTKMGRFINSILIPPPHLVHTLEFPPPFPLFIFIFTTPFWFHRIALFNTIEFGCRLCACTDAFVGGTVGDPAFTCFLIWGMMILDQAISDLRRKRFTSICTLS